MAATTPSAKQLPKAQSPWAGGHVEGVGFTVGLEIANAIIVSLQLQNGRGADLAVKGAVNFYLASDVGGNAIHAAPAGGIAAGTDGLLIENLDNQSGIAVSEDDGDIDLVITDASGANTYYLCVVLPDGRVAISPAITFA